MRTSLCKAHPPCNTPKTTSPAQRLFMRQIAINATAVGLQGQVKNPASRGAHAARSRSKISLQKRSSHTHQPDQSLQTKGNVLHHHPPTSHLEHQRSIFFN
ncbi:hypothetical protein CFN58_04960 [Pseudomonas avellanae]|uniref:Uncharacterized protein n=2 Tax=Pseudomonas syringae group TaxID=136849 RepID=A0A261WMT7_9PSED|nr:hypothetical protein CT122_01335 [Pseudomonas syringae pv. actinidiae]MBL3830507.1 hypothetical protein [Pseudomonas syringae pv. theae]OZI87282.1 hypothetical protein CFN58_04960 [Pseudomonas avellanae]MBL3836422.1 hypothetical protein [Pseudomonas syringae pv. theae]MBL3870263.1 hypothetical protein [Pseudomonas syringae pv. theae]